METLIDDLLHAQPDALLMLAGLAFIFIALVGSVKAYFDPGKVGRIAAGAVGGVLLIAGLIMYKPVPPAPTTSAEQAVAASSGTTAGQTTTFCYIPGKWPVEVGKSMAAGDSCTGPAGKPGKAVVASKACSYTSGPKSGTSEEFNHEMFVGFSCVSPDKQSKGTVLAPGTKN